MTPKLEADFDAAMMDIYVRAKSEANYVASIFHRMLTELRALATAKYLINDPNVPQGYTVLWGRGPLDPTVEAPVIGNERWPPLFDEDELKRARKQLSEYRYFD